MSFNFTSIQTKTKTKNSKTKSKLIHSQTFPTLSSLLNFINTKTLHTFYNPITNKFQPLLPSQITSYPFKIQNPLIPSQTFTITKN